ncbi:MAG: SDR family NAD(P)-dependent oxidoreductase, partial [Gammaproteobacteria bacterium]|nr:SDR family NAD(P)-dependent oxidoreductase [Gammaproteobacteria bacterium]
AERRVALVTAAAGAGIGAAIARRLAADGYDVVITDAHERRCGAFASQLADEHGREFLSMPLDVTDFDAVGAVTRAVVEQRGRIDALVNNAGWSRIEPVAEMTPDTWLRCLDVDLNGTFSGLYTRVTPRSPAKYLHWWRRRESNPRRQVSTRPPRTSEHPRRAACVGGI